MFCEDCIMEAELEEYEKVSDEDIEGLLSDFLSYEPEYEPDYE